ALLLRAAGRRRPGDHGGAAPGGGAPDQPGHPGDVPAHLGDQRGGHRHDRRVRGSVLTARTGRTHLTPARAAPRLPPRTATRQVPASEGGSGTLEAAPQALTYLRGRLTSEP